jgi:hypothetical protein
VFAHEGLVAIGQVMHADLQVARQRPATYQANLEQSVAVVI